MRIKDYEPDPIDPQLNRHRLQTLVNKDRICDYHMNDHVLLLRSPSEPDAYHRELSALGFTPHSIAPLETVFTNETALVELLAVTPTVTGVIFTSARSAEAWRAAHAAYYDSPSYEPLGALRAWVSLPHYVVGPSTATALTSSDPTRPDLPSVTDIRGQESGTGAKLGQYIVDELGEKQTEMLFLTGDKNRETLPDMLKEAGVELKQVQVYETRGAEAFGGELKGVVEDTRGQDIKWWIVCFAPSSTSFALPHLQQHFHLRSTTEDPTKPASESLPTARIAAIGPTTATHLTETLGLHVDVVSPKPNAKDLAASLHAHGSTDS